MGSGLISREIRSGMIVAGRALEPGQIFMRL
jgi:hypothetical protein